MAFSFAFIASLLAGSGAAGNPRQPPQRAALTAVGEPGRVAAIEWAESQQGKWYCWGGTGPSCFDCSGLVTSAYQQVGVPLPRSTYQMLRSPLLVRIPAGHAHRGDLAFYGPGHVEFVTVWHATTFGSLQTGARIGWHRWSRWWHPTMYFRVRQPRWARP